MYNKAIAKYFWDVNMFNIPFSFLLGISVGFLWSIVSFATFGFLIGLIGFNFFKKNEYYAYHNLGFTKLYLAKKVGFINVCIVVLFLIIYSIFK